MELKKDQIYRLLRERIYRGEYPTGMKLPRELEFASDLGVSFITLRAALKRLEEKELISRQRGRGTFVNSLPAAPSFQMKQILLLYPDDENKAARTNLFNRQLLLGVVDWTLQERYSVMPEAAPAGRVLLNRFLDGEISGIIWDRPAENDVLNMLRRAGVPQVTVNRCCDGIPSVACDYPAAIRQAMWALRQIGHQAVALIDIGGGEAVFCERRDAFYGQLRLNGIDDLERYLVALGDIPRIGNPNYLEERLFRIAESMKKIPEVTAVIVSNLYIEAFEFYLLEKRIAIPHDLTVIQWGEITGFERDSGHVYGLLTEPREMVGRRSAMLIHRCIRGDDCTGIHELINGELIMRKGCALPRYWTRRWESASGGQVASAGCYEQVKEEK